jgi:hypothetical protein
MEPTNNEDSITKDIEEILGCIQKNEFHGLFKKLEALLPPLHQLDNDKLAEIQCLLLAIRSSYKTPGNFSSKELHNGAVIIDSILTLFQVEANRRIKDLEIKQASEMARLKLALSSITAGKPKNLQTHIKEQLEPHLKQLQLT